MSDYMFMLDSHLTAEQSKAVAAVRDGAESANLNLFLTGGAMRDMMGGFAIRDLDFTVEGGSVKFARTIAQKTHAEILSVDELREVGGIGVSGQCDRQHFHGAAGEISETRRQAAGSAGHHTRRFARARFHSECHRPIARKGFTGIAARSGERPGRPEPEGTARDQ